MAEQEVIKHTKKVYKIWNSKDHGIWHNIKEFLIEIFIIVFAITLSIWLHEKSEHSHQQKVVKEFLSGLKSDLKNDVKEMSADKASFIESKGAFHYLTTAAKNNALQKDSLKIYQKGIFISIQFVLNDGRYEGFKSSGNLGNIENPVLQNDIVNFYQEDIKTLLVTTNYYALRKEKFFDFYINNLKKQNDSTNGVALLMSDVGQNYTRTLGQLDEVISRYDSCINKANKIIVEIDEEYR